MPLCLPPPFSPPSTGYCGNPLRRKDGGSQVPRKVRRAAPFPLQVFFFYHSVCLSEASPAFLLISLFSVSPSLGDSVPVKFHFLSFLLSRSLSLSVSLCLYSFLSLWFFSIYVCMSLFLLCSFPPLPLSSPQTPAALAAHALIWPSGGIQRGPLAKATCDEWVS